MSLFINHCHNISHKKPNWCYKIDRSYLPYNKFLFNWKVQCLLSPCFNFFITTSNIYLPNHTSMINTSGKRQVYMKEVPLCYSIKIKSWNFNMESKHKIWFKDIVTKILRYLIKTNINILKFKCVIKMNIRDVYYQTCKPLCWQWTS